MFPANVINIMIAGPSDVSSEVECVKSVIYEWNEINAPFFGLVLRPIHWKTSSFPSLSYGDAQEAINHQLVETSDVLICLFGHRLGTQTPRSESGTVEEIKQHLMSGKEVMVFFKGNIDANCDLEQFTALRLFQSHLQEKGLLGSYYDIGKLKDEVSRRLQLFINNFVQTLRKPISHNSSSKEEAISLFTKEEEDILRLWCTSDNNSYNKINFESGRCVYVLGTTKYEVVSGREIAKWNKFFKILLEQGLIEHTGRYTKQREPVYKLTSKAYAIYS